MESDVIRRAMAGEGFQWLTIMSELWILMNELPPSDNTIQIFQEIEQFEGLINVLPNEDGTYSDGPHSRSPEEMLKFLARQWKEKSDPATLHDE